LGLLVLVLGGISVMVIIALVASRASRPERPAQVAHNGREAVTLEKLAVYNVVELEGLINLLIAKGIITNEELLGEIEALKGKETEEGEAQ